ncbi:MAG: hypothetical protein F9K23_13015 [Bacteroidetes bacterium]|nr:MAG: hypothetical protein F9K23_13005 [Bacteroidota bacterium]KAB2914644.1 MAG: hypothetical protein F9K23_13015 [Bacteroidota bacterium]
MMVYLRKQVLIIFLIIFIGCNWKSNAEIEEISKTISRYSESYRFEENGDTLKTFIYLDYLRSENITSFFVLRDLIAINIYEDFDKSNYKYFKIFGLRKPRDSVNLDAGLYEFFSNVYSKSDIREAFKQHKNCKALLEVKEYINKNCESDWIYYGNKFVRDARTYDSTFRRLEISYIQDNYFDIISILIGYAAECCSLQETENGRVLRGLQRRRYDTDSTLFKQIWPHYGNHVINIMEICQKGAG